MDFTTYIDGRLIRGTEVLSGERYVLTVITVEFGRSQGGKYRGVGERGRGC